MKKLFSFLRQVPRNLTLRQALGLLTLVALLIIVGLLLPSDLAFIRWFAAYNAALSMVAMAFAFVLATRLPILERLFGGLDKLYILHRWAGMIAVVTIFLHWMLVPQPIHYADSTFAGIGSDAGEWATWLLLGLIALTFSGFIPYRYWKFTHKLMGVVFIISVMHFLLAVKPFALFSPVGLLMLLISIIGIAAWVYYAFGFNRSKRMLGKVKAIRHLDNTIEFSIRPIGGVAAWQAGQFAFISFLRNAHISDESHPFTISSAPTVNNNANKAQKQLARWPRFSVAALGDYTKDLAKYIQENDNVALEMPYGDFTFNKHAKKQVWIGAGIGVTPFLAWLNSNLSIGDQHITFYYCVKDENSAIYHAEIENLCRNSHPNLDYQVVYSAKGRLNAEKIIADAGGKIDDARVYFCGSPAMRDNLKTALIEQSLAPKHFYYEHFDFRGT